MSRFDFDDPQLDGRSKWLMEESGNVHITMRALARRADRRNRRQMPEVA